MDYRRSIDRSRERGAQTQTRDDFSGAVDGGADGELDEVDEELAYLMAAGQIRDGGSMCAVCSNDDGHSGGSDLQ